MKKPFLALRHSLVVCLMAAAALTSCNRAEYAMLPKTSSPYHDTQYAVTAPKPAAVAEAPVATPEAAPAAAVAPVVSPAPAVAATPAPAAKPTKAAKLNLMQKALVKKVTKQANKVASKVQVRQKSETAETNRLDSNIRTGIILLIAALLVGLLSGISGVGTIFGIISAILAIIGIVLIILGLLDAV